MKNWYGKDIVIGLIMQIPIQNILKQDYIKVIMDVWVLVIKNVGIFAMIFILI